MKIWDGLDDSIVGVVECFGGDLIVAYDYQKIHEILVHRDGMTGDEAAEHISHNIIGAYIGDGTPCIFHPMSANEIHQMADENNESIPSQI